MWVLALAALLGLAAYGVLDTGGEELDEDTQDLLDGDPVDILWPNGPTADEIETPEDEAETPATEEEPTADEPIEVFLDEDNASFSGGPEAEIVRGDDLENVSISTAGGEDVIQFVSGSGTLDGGEGDDTIAAGLLEFESQIFGGEGDDRISQVTGASIIDGGTGNDTITSLDTGDATIEGGAGNDEIETAGYFGVTNGGAGDDTITATGPVEFVNAGDGDDVLNVSGWGFELSRTDGGAGDDIVRISDIDNTILQSGNGFAQSVTGGAGADTFEYTLDPSQVYDPTILSGSVINVGVVGTINDFAPGEDVLVVQAPLSGTTGNELITTSTLPADDGSYLDVTLEFGYAADPSLTQVFTIRLLGVDALNEGDLVVVDSTEAAVA